MKNKNNQNNPKQTKPETKSQARVTMGERRCQLSSSYKSEILCLELMTVDVTLLQSCPLCASDLPFIQYSTLWFLSNLSEGNFSLLSHLYHDHQQFFLLETHTAHRFTGEHLLIWLQILKLLDWTNSPSPTHDLLSELPAFTN